MKNKLKITALLLTLAILLIPVFSIAVTAEDTTDMIESTDTPSGKETGKEDGSLIGDITGALTTDGDNDKDTETEKDGVMSDIESGAESMLPDKDKGDGNISTGDDGTIDETAKDDDAGMNVWVIVIAIIIIVAVLILIFAMMPKRKD